MAKKRRPPNPSAAQSSMVESNEHWQRVLADYRAAAKVELRLVERIGAVAGVSIITALAFGSTLAGLHALRDLAEGAAFKSTLSRFAETASSIQSLSISAAVILAGAIYGSAMYYISSEIDRRRRQFEARLDEIESRAMELSGRTVEQLDELDELAAELSRLTLRGNALSPLHTRDDDSSKVAA